MSELYQERIIDHYRNPRNFGSLEHPTHQATGRNPACGDSLEMDLLVSHGTISDVRFSGSGCAISQASASLLTEYVLGKKVETALAIEPKIVLDLLGVTLSPTRMKCGLLSLETLKRVLQSEKERDVPDNKITINE